MSANAAYLVPSRERGWRMGLTNMLAKENGAWWRTRRWWLQCLIWLGLLNGTIALNIRGDIPLDAAVEVFFVMAALGLPIAAISMGQDSVLGERHSGTAAWVLSKPIGRPAFILAKLIANGLGFLATGVVLPGAVAYIQITAVGRPHLSVLGFAGAMGLVYINLLFYLTIALMLATLFHGRGPVLGITLGLLIGFQMILKLAPWLEAVMPWRLLLSTGRFGSLAGYLTMGRPLPTLTPIIATVLWCALFVVVAIWRFRREEF
jgi:ABC-type transport system involved in multi-copper enzyme maturation permease subunit